MTLAELMIALALGTLVLAGGLNLLSVSAGSQVHAARQTRLQGDAFLAWRAVEVELRQSTAILTPAVVGAQSDVLTGCANYDARLGALNPAGLGALDPAAAVSGFMFCESSGSVYLHRLATCPPATLPTCGSSGGVVVAGGVSQLASPPSYFSRPAPGLVRFGYQTSASGQSQPVDVSVAFNAAAGGNQ